MSSHRKRLRGNSITVVAGPVTPPVEPPVEPPVDPEYTTVSGTLYSTTTLTFPISVDNITFEGRGARGTVVNTYYPGQPYIAPYDPVYGWKLTSDPLSVETYYEGTATWPASPEWAERLSRGWFGEWVKLTDPTSPWESGSSLPWTDPSMVYNSPNYWEPGAMQDAFPWSAVLIMAQTRPTSLISDVYGRGAILANIYNTNPIYNKGLQRTESLKTISSFIEFYNNPGQPYIAPRTTTSNTTGASTTVTGGGNTLVWPGSYGDTTPTTYTKVWTNTNNYYNQLVCTVPDGGRLYYTYTY